LLTFFVLLISFSSIQEVKFQKAIGSLQGALGVLKADRGAYIQAPRTPNYEFSPEESQYMLEKMMEEVKQIAEQESTPEAQLSVEKSKDRIHFSISSPMLFASGSAELRPKPRHAAQHCRGAGHRAL
jgi:chemotaxis protein MotB